MEKNPLNIECGHDASPEPDKISSRTALAPRDIKDLRRNPGNSNVHIFTYEEMRLSTNRFRPDLILGEGGFGVVYKGVIDENIRPGFKSTQVAIKELNREGFQGDREWLVCDLSCRLRFFPLPMHENFTWVNFSAKKSTEHLLQKTKYKEVSLMNIRGLNIPV